MKELTPLPSVQRYIPLNYENFIDKYIVQYCKVFYPFFKKLNFTPNTLTTFSLVLGLLTCYTFYKKKYKLSAILLFSSYIFDVLDGDYARKYKMVTKFGDYYDHIKDLIVYSCFAIIFIIFNRYSKKNLIIIIIISCLFLLSILFNLICKMKYIEKGNKEHRSHTFKYLADLIPIINCDKIMSYLRYFDAAAFVLVITIIVFMHPKN